VARTSTAAGSASSSTTSETAGGGGLSTGGKIAVGTAVPLAAIAFALILGFLAYLRRKRRASAMADPGYGQPEMAMPPEPQPQAQPPPGDIRTGNDLPIGIVPMYAKGEHEAGPSPDPRASYGGAELSSEPHSAYPVGISPVPRTGHTPVPPYSYKEYDAQLSPHGKGSNVAAPSPYAVHSNAAELEAGQGLKHQFGFGMFSGSKS
jgi:hypothetical protein